MNNQVWWLLGAAFWCLVVYGIFYFFKSFSWWIFYEGFALDLICEMVKPEHLITPSKCE